jgi:hypothetical protein
MAFGPSFRGIAASGHAEKEDIHDYEFQAAARCEIPRMACRWTVEIHGISDGDDVETDPVAIGLSGES